MSIWKVVPAAVIIAALVAALYPAVQAAREVAWRMERINNLKRIGLGLLNFRDSYGRLPPAVLRDDLGRPLSSWRLQIDPYLEARMLNLDFGDRWDEPANRWLTARPHWGYCLHPERYAPECLHTNVVAVTGPGTAFEENGDGCLKEIDADTILAVEVASSGVHWAEPGDLRVDEVGESIPAGPEGNGLCVLFADGAVWFLTSDVPVEDLRKFFTVRGAMEYDRELILGAYKR